MNEGISVCEYYMKFDTKKLPTRANERAPDGSEIRLLPKMNGGGLSHCTLLAGKTSYPVVHRHVEEIWYVLEGEGEVWRKNSGVEEIVSVCAGTSLTIPPHTAFQFRNTGAGPLHILIMTMPPWPGPQEAERAIGPWRPTVIPDEEQKDVGKERGES